jgi:hypothetical protein
MGSIWLEYRPLRVQLAKRGLLQVRFHLQSQFGLVFAKTQWDLSCLIILSVCRLCDWRFENVMSVLKTAYTLFELKFND